MTEQLLEQMVAWEEGALGEEETIDLFRDLIETGLAWSLQGVYGRTAESLIRSGVIDCARNEDGVLEC